MERDEEVRRERKEGEGGGGEEKMKMGEQPPSTPQYQPTLAYLTSFPHSIFPNPLHTTHLNPQTSHHTLCLTIISLSQPHHIPLLSHSHSLVLPTHSTPPISTPTPHLTSPIPPYPSLTLHIPTPISSPSPLHQPSPLIPYPTITSLSPPHSNSLTSHHPQPIPPPPHLISPHLTLPTPPLHPSHLPTVTLSPLTILNLFHHHLTLFHLTSHPLPHHYIPLTSSLHTTPPCYLTQFV
ncbi:hypothetical protein Pcinc_009424 [Petrolisthes cinctipes]|uniref:Uncharacterized protein n=1 Tax=Petrolisthes cinctipes TaxID=88211 RepID=A0AAE1KYH9_PETCI|nr:hypothetical protein Pcinc_009424 [Petrolisthes cinctipes]